MGDIVLSVNPYALTMVPADGSTLQITANEALFSVLGTRFGGNGTTTFNLPDLRNATPAGLYYSICVLGLYPSPS
jgi:microcystin-dependent protein